MYNLSDLKKINSYEWEIPREVHSEMRVPVRLFATQEILEGALKDHTLQQAVNAATLPGLVGSLLVMPDMHEGYGFPIGGVGATRLTDGIISPGGIGYDINCGVRLLASQIPLESVFSELDELASAINHLCPSGVGGDGIVRLSSGDLDKVCLEGARWAFKKGYATESDIRRTEDNGMLEGANPDKISKRAKERGRPQLGSLGAGNHFIEVDLIEEIFSDKAARVMGLQVGCLAVQIHTGSRGFGHQVCTDYVQALQGAVQHYGIKIPDRELVCAPLDSEDGRDYLAAMRAAANYAFANRQILTHQVRLAFERTMAGFVKNWQLHQIYDVAHNIGKIETHMVDGKQVKVCVHRKGATRAFGPGSVDIPAEYRSIGQPVLVPGSMGTASWILVGTAEGMERSFGSTCHGAGRTMSRHQAKKSIRAEELRQTLEGKGIHLRSGSISGLVEEAPAAYKDVDAIVETVSCAGIAQRVARIRPLIVIKG